MTDLNVDPMPHVACAKKTKPKAIYENLNKFPALIFNMKIQAIFNMVEGG